MRSETLERDYQGNPYYWSWKDEGSIYIESFPEEQNGKWTSERFEPIPVGTCRSCGAPVGDHKYEGIYSEPHNIKIVYSARSGYCEACCKAKEGKSPLIGELPTQIIKERYGSDFRTVYETCKGKTMIFEEYAKPGKQFVGGSR